MATSGGMIGGQCGNGHSIFGGTVASSTTNTNNVIDYDDSFARKPVNKC